MEIYDVLKYHMDFVEYLNLVFSLFISICLFFINKRMNDRKWFNLFIIFSFIFLYEIMEWSGLYFIQSNFINYTQYVFLNISSALLLLYSIKLVKPQIKINCLSVIIGAILYTIIFIFFGIYYQYISSLIIMFASILSIVILSAIYHFKSPREEVSNTELLFLLTIAIHLFIIAMTFSAGWQFSNINYYVLFNLHISSNIFRFILYFILFIELFIIYSW